MIEGGSTLSVNEHPDHSYMASPSFVSREISAQKAARDKAVLHHSNNSTESQPHDAYSPPASPSSSSPPRDYRRDRSRSSSSSSSRRSSTHGYSENGGQEDMFSSPTRRSRRLPPSLTTQTSCSDFVRGEHGRETISSRDSTRGYSDNYSRGDIRPPSSIPPMPVDPLVRGSSSGNNREGERHQYPSSHQQRSPPSFRRTTSRPGAFTSSAPNSFDEVFAKLEMDRQQSLGDSSAYSRSSGDSYYGRGGHHHESGGGAYDRTRYPSSPRRGGGDRGGYDRHHNHHSTSDSPRGRRSPSPPRPSYQKEQEHYSYDSYSSSSRHNQQQEQHRPSRRLDYNEHHQEPPRSYDRQQHQHQERGGVHYNDRYEQSQLHQQEPEQTIEIAPGTHARLRGAQETWECVERDFYMPVTCILCNMDLCCIMDANYVLCPSCRVVSPMEGSGGTEGGKADGGVGLGFTFEDLQRWQMEILQKRNEKR